MQISLTNTLTRRKEPFVPADPKRVTMYVCGPTVYNFAHIGNARPPVVFDTLFRLLRHVYGEQHVIYARNYTDIDDKIIAASIARNVPIAEITRSVEEQYDADMGALGVLLPTLRPRATENVPAMIGVIEKLIANDVAYVVPSGVYFSVASDEDYGKLSGRSQDDLKAGARVEGEDDKRHPSDFALWKTSKPGEPAWEAPFGAGRPGWHIECSAMIEEELGSPIDIHGGGVDLIFPHHENEIAQSESAHGHPLARVWMHNGFLTMDATKMSKSLGNIITPRELLEQGWQGETLRWALLSAHYKAPLDWTEDLLRQSKAKLDSLYQLLRDADEFLVSAQATPSQTAVNAFLEAFVLPALRDDLNTPEAMSKLSMMQKAIRGRLELAKHDPSWFDARIQSHAQGMQYLADEVAALRASGLLLGLLQADPVVWFGGASDDSAEIDALVAARVAARAAKDYALSDKIRDALAARGVEVMDSASGSTWRRKG
jgi:cysteinyl-tRNA synthetase